MIEFLDIVTEPLSTESFLGGLFGYDEELANGIAVPKGIPLEFITPEPPAIVNEFAAINAEELAKPFRDTQLEISGEFGADSAQYNEYSNNLDSFIALADEIQKEAQTLSDDIKARRLTPEEIEQRIAALEAKKAELDGLEDKLNQYPQRGIPI